jgi:Skp family chaperone for outer membrane proteins
MATADLKIAVVDLGKTFDNYYKTKDASSRIEEKKNAFQKEYQDLVSEYQHMSDDGQKLQDRSKDQTLSQAARDDATKALQQKVQDLQNMQRKIEEMKTERSREIQDEIVRRHKEIVDEIAKVIVDYSSPQGYDLVLDKSTSSSASGAPFVLFSSSKLIDITNDIVTKLNSTQPAGGTPATTAPAPSGTAPAPTAH